MYEYYSAFHIECDSIRGCQVTVLKSMDCRFIIENPPVNIIIILNFPLYLRTISNFNEKLLPGML